MRTSVVVAALFVGQACVAPEGRPDAGEPDANVTVVAIQSDGGPLAGVAVVSQEADGGVRGGAVTGSDGLAVVYVPPGGMVSAAGNDPFTLRNITTWFGVEAGDTLRWGMSQTTSVPDGRHVMVTVPEYAGAHGYVVELPCGFGSSFGFPPATTVDVQLKSGCGAEADVLALVDIAPGNFPAYSFTRGFSLDAGSLTIGSWESSFATLEWQVQGADAGDFAQFRNMLAIDGFAFYSSEVQRNVWTDADGGAAFSYSYPAIADAGVVSSVSVASPDGKRLTGLARGWAVAPPASITAAVGSDLLPQLGLDSATSSGMSWHIASDADVEGFVAEVDFNGSLGAVRWNVVAPPGTRSFAFPPLPSELASYGIPSGAAFSWRRVSAIDSTELADYRAFRQVAPHFVPNTSAGSFRFRNSFGQ